MIKQVLLVSAKFLGALLLGSVVALGLAQNDTWLKNRIEHQVIDSLSSIIGELVHGTLTSIDLLGGEIIMSDVRAVSSAGDWSFSAPHLSMKISWLSGLRSATYDAYLTLEKPQVVTDVHKGVFAISRPLNALASAPMTLPITFKKYRLDKGIFTLKTTYGEWRMRATSISSVEKRSIVTTFWCEDGRAVYKQALFAQYGQGQIVFDSPHDGAPYTLTVNLRCTRPLGASGGSPVPYYFYYRSTSQKGLCRWRAEDGSLSLLMDDITSTDTELKGSLSLQGDLRELASYTPLGTATAFSGKGFFDGTLTITDEECFYAGVASLRDATWGGIPVSSAALALEGTEKRLKADVTQAQSLGMNLKGKIHGSLDEQYLKGELSLQEPYSGLPKCTITQGKAVIAYKDSAIKADISGSSSFFKGSAVPLKGTVHSDLKTVQLKGTCGTHAVDADVILDPLKVKKVLVQEGTNSSCLELGDHTAGGLQGTVDGTLIKKILELITGHRLVGSLQTKVSTKETQQGLSVHLAVEEASLKIPGTYTLIKELSATCDVNAQQRSLTVRDLNVAFHKGSARASRATFIFDKEGGLESAHVPLQLHEVFVSKHKEMFGTFSGGITLTYSQERWLCEGLITIDTAHVRSNLFSSNVQKDLLGTSLKGLSFGPLVDLALKVHSRAPLKVQTTFLTADAYLDLSLGGVVDKPLLKGTLAVAQGSLNFPYKPLLITSGTILLAHEQPDGPTIDLTAKNKIRTYTVTLRVTGSVSQPSIVFESVPALSEEQIMTLLLAGSDQGSLTAAMPRMIMQQIEHLLFGSEESLSTAQQILRTILTPLKNVRLVKKEDTSDQLQAVVEVDINDRLRAKAQNNLQLSDETQLELEYALSDDVTLKAVRDKTGSLGGEVEMRWKF